MTPIQIVEKKIIENRFQVNYLLVSDTCADFAMYRHLTGKIKAYDIVLEEISDAIKKAYQDEDEE